MVNHKVGLKLTCVVPHNVKASNVDLKGGDNVFNVSISGAILSEACFKLISRTNPELSCISSLVTFIAIDFYEFETTISGIGLGSKPLYKHQSKYEIIYSRFSVTIDDFFLYVLQTERLALRVFYTNGTDFFPLGYWYVKSLL